MEDQLHQIGIVAIAGILGSIVGIEREIADKPAGLRTHMFVCASSAMLMLLGDGVLDQFQAEDYRSVSADPIRIIQAIVVGISFLGAGTIIHHHDNHVEGLTTAASILLTAGIGVAVANGQLVFATGVAVLAVAVLVVVGWIERQLQARRNAKSKKEMVRSSQRYSSTQQESI